MSRDRVSSGDERTFEGDGNTRTRTAIGASPIAMRRATYAAEKRGGVLVFVCMWVIGERQRNSDRSDLIAWLSSGPISLSGECS